MTIPLKACKCKNVGMNNVGKITPHLWFNGNADEAVHLYIDLFGADSTILTTTHYPTEGLLDFQEPLAGELLNHDFTLRGHRFMAVNAGDEFRPNPALSFMVNFDPLDYDGDVDAARADLDQIWAGLIDGGTALMPLQEYPFSAHYGWVEDRYGVSWQLILSDQEGEPRPFIMPALMFGGENQNRAQDAVEFWTALFPNSEVGMQVPYGEDTGPATARSLMFSDFTLNGQWFVASDSGVDQDFTFTEGISLLVECEDQAEIDHLWAELSAHPEAEACGWCKDRFGVSWQINPKNMGELMERPNAFEKMLGMKKLIIDDF